MFVPASSAKRQMCGRGGDLLEPRGRKRKTKKREIRSAAGKMTDKHRRRGSKAAFLW